MEKYNENCATIKTNVKEKQKINKNIRTFIIGRYKYCYLNDINMFFL